MINSWTRIAAVELKRNYTRGTWEKEVSTWCQLDLEEVMRGSDKSHGGVKDQGL